MLIHQPGASDLLPMSLIKNHSAARCYQKMSLDLAKHLRFISYLALGRIDLIKKKAILSLEFLSFTEPWSPKSTQGGKPGSFENREVLSSGISVALGELCE